MSNAYGQGAQLRLESRVKQLERTQKKLTIYARQLEAEIERLTGELLNKEKLLREATAKKSTTKKTTKKATAKKSESDIQESEKVDETESTTEEAS